MSEQELAAKVEEINAKAKAEIEQLLASVKPELAKAEAAVTSEVQKLKGKPLWFLVLLVAGILFALAYLAWSMFHKPAPSTEVFVPTPPAVSTPKVDGTPFKVRPKIVPKAAVQKKFPTAVIAPQEEVADTAKIPDAPYGGTAIVTDNPDTGEIKTQFKPNASPWFAFEDKNYLGGGYHVSSNGSYVPIWFKRDIAQIKEVHLQVEVGGRVPIDATAKSEAHAGINLEYRWNGIVPW